MQGICLLAIAVIGVDVGWQPVENGELEYIIQISPHQVRSLKAGDVIEVGVRPALRHVRRYRIVVGTDTLPREDSTAAPLGTVKQTQSITTVENLGRSIVVPPRQSDDPVAPRGPQWVAANDPSSPSAISPVIPTQPIDRKTGGHDDPLEPKLLPSAPDAERTATRAIPPGPASGKQEPAASRYDLLVPPVTALKTDGKSDAVGYRYGDSVPIRPPVGDLLPGQDSGVAPETDSENDPAKRITLPPPPNTSSRETGLFELPPPPAESAADLSAPAGDEITKEPLGGDPARSTTAAKLLPLQPVAENEPEKNGPALQTDPSRNASAPQKSSSDRPAVATVEIPPQRSRVELSEDTVASGNSSWALTSTLCVLFASLGGNFYLGWITWDIRNRFRRRFAGQADAGGKEDQAA